MCNTGPYVTVDERLVPFKGRCPFRQYEHAEKASRFGHFVTPRLAMLLEHADLHRDMSIRYS
ncbi:hypothetical protein T07_5506 [Trichinella nelsoni]|uniref:PiggyBac transposable element-derived protein domain-containing protein n=1 Tax=Trichinella nelsoni TaxID=6336 RepID=A0A0V0REY4_9BILA|nr:hypothetical protein T07_5506 [Trichinella nelsoni]